MILLKRILAEKRAAIIPLAIGILANIGVYLLVVYPLGVKSAGAENRAARRAYENAGMRELGRCGLMLRG